MILDPVQITLENPYLVRNGYYTVGTDVYTSKILALMTGSTQHVHPEWQFNQSVFDHVDWRREPAASLTELYRQRAREIREKHDYVVVMFSGGIDSTTVLESFLDQGLKIDEIVTTWSVQAAEAYHGDINDRSPENCISEWVYCTKPALNKIHKLHPDIKITVIDSTTDICNNVYREEDFFEFDHFHNLPSMNRWPALVHKLREIGNEHPNHCVLLGLDKPHFRVQGKELYLYFIDTNIFLKSSAGLNVEYFFWSPQAVEILQKQCHVIFRHFQNHPHLIPMLNHRDDNLLAVLNYCIYPSYDPMRFQAKKTTTQIYNDQQIWAWKLSQYQDGSYEDRWLSEWKNFLSAIDPKYTRYKYKLFHGLVGFITKDYYIGKFK